MWNNVFGSPTTTTTNTNTPPDLLDEPILTEGVEVTLTNEDDDDEEEEHPDYVPDSLAQFLEQARNTLRDAKEDFMQADQTLESTNNNNSEDDWWNMMSPVKSPPPPILPDTWTVAKKMKQQDLMDLVTLAVDQQEDNTTGSSIEQLRAKVMQAQEKTQGWTPQRPIVLPDEQLIDTPNRDTKGNAVTTEDEKETNNTDKIHTANSITTPAAVSTNKMASRLTQGTAASQARSESPSVIQSPTLNDPVASSKPSSASPAAASANKATSRLTQGTAASQARSESPSVIQSPTRNDPVASSKPSSASPVAVSANKVTSRLTQGTAASQARREASLGESKNDSSHWNKSTSSSIESSVKTNQVAVSQSLEEDSSPTKTPKFITRLIQGTAASEARRKSAEVASETPLVDSKQSGKDDTADFFHSPSIVDTSDEIKVFETPLLSSDGSARRKMDKSRLTHSTAASQSREKSVEAMKQQTSRDKPTFARSATTSKSRMMQTTAANEARRLSVQMSNHSKAALDNRPTLQATVDEGVLRAQERVRQRQLQLKANKENMRGPANATRRISNRTGVPNAASGPRYAVETKQGISSWKNEPSLAQSSYYFGKALRHEIGPAIPRPSREKPSLTIPEAPKFATDVRLGPKQVSESPASLDTHTNCRHPRDDRSVDTHNSQSSKIRSLTIPRAPKFATSAKLGERKPTPKGNSDAPSLAQSSDILAKGLRQGAPTLPREKKLTIPRAPKFHEVPKRQLPKSSEELELEMIRELQSTRFKARPFLLTSSVPNVAKKYVNERRSTIPQPFKLHSTIERATTERKPRVSNVANEEEDSHVKFQFRARPMPKFMQPVNSSAVGKIHSVKAVTTPEPFMFSAGKPKSFRKSDTAEDDTFASFKARPVPKSTFSPPTPRSPRGFNPDSETKSFTLHTLSRTGKRASVVEASQRRAERIAGERVEQTKRRQKEKLLEAISKAEERLPIAAETKPFKLHSNARHEAYQQKLAGKLKEEEAKKRREARFRARSFVPPPQPDKVTSPRREIEVQPFQLQSISRHQAFEEEKRRKLEEEDAERKRQAQFKAKPVPKTTYIYKKPPITEKADLVDPMSPELQLKNRVIERESYDQRAEKERQAEIDRKKTVQERMRAEEEQELRERRNLPVSEGGMIPTAQPVNSVFFSE